VIDFVDCKYDVLVATTIIENGIDIPRANTIVINRADAYGLSQLYQLRGRVGRSNRRAYAYLLIPSDQELSPIARKRLAAIREFSDLGAGFRIAALDLELRGAHFESVQVLSPVEVGINQDPAAIFWAPRQFVKERQIIGVGLETRYEKPNSYKKYAESCGVIFSYPDRFQGTSEPNKEERIYG